MNTPRNSHVTAALPTRARTMVIALGMVLIALFWSIAANAAPAANPAICGERAAVLTTLDGKYAERPVSMGIASNGTVVEVLSSEDGSWTIIMTTPGGVSCLLAAGDYWQDTPEKAAGLAL